jgi:hypothetical protein
MVTGEPIEGFQADGGGPCGHTTALFVEVDDTGSVERALDRAEIVQCRLGASHPATGIAVRKPGGALCDRIPGSGLRSRGRRKGPRGNPFRTA